MVKLIPLTICTVNFLLKLLFVVYSNENTSQENQYKCKLM